ncbi:MAG: CPBP family intramembrane metalloprotease [Clostridia bacterium]|nr:CPBP family intramembrane metalloprotease [Clostridia bacterium]
MNNNEYREGENGFTGQPDNTQYPYGQNPGNTQYPYGQQPGNMQYPYGQNPGNTQYPFGRDRGYGPPYPYGGPYGYARPPKKTLGRRVREAFADPARRELMLLGMAAGSAVLMMLLFSDIFSTVITGSREVYQRYLNDETFSLLLETMFTMICTALPFALVFGIVHKTGLSRAEMSFGRPQGGWQTVLLLPAGLGICFIGNILSNYIVTFAGSFGVTFRSYEYTMAHQTDTPDTLWLLLLTIVHTAVLPALLEELAFRGFLMQPLRKYGDWFAIVSSALIFGLVHGNMLQAPFAIFAGIALGYVNVVSGSMWMNILLHFLNNLISVLYSIALDSAGENGTIILSLLVTYGIVAVGIVAFIGYALCNRNFMRLRPGTAPRFAKKSAHYWLMPTMVIALLLIFREIALDVMIK